MKKRSTFVLSLEWEKLFGMLGDGECKDLMTAIFAYENDRKFDESTMRGSSGLVWAFIQPRLADYRESYEEKCRINAENGKKGGRPRKNKTERFCEETEINRKKHDYDYDCDYYNDYDDDCDDDLDCDYDCDCDADSECA